MSRELTILYVEDDPSSILLLEEALAEVSTPTTVHAVESASEALAFLAREGAHEAAPRPDLVLLDLDLGESSGLDVLEELQARDERSSPPIVMFTSSTEPADVTAAYDRGANAYVQKPTDFDSLSMFADRAVDFWGLSSPVTETAH